MPKARRRNRKRSLAVRTIDVPVPDENPGPLELLAKRLGSITEARKAALQVATELGLPEDAPESVSAALALTRLGSELGPTARSLDWGEFEDYCAMAISAAGYTVSRNVRLRKPTRQIDIVAESPTLGLSIDCKHWGRGAGPAGLTGPALAQIERTRQYVEKSRSSKSFLPVLLTMENNLVTAVEGVPVVPLAALPEFLATVNRFDESLCFLPAPRLS